ncbi:MULTISPECIES: TetR/AcrR family transcriptional regulator [unclassified Streptosporangium]|uniref:TetR/AcrR family transcriptional regulator n=1 Tax=Streptosporangium sp. NPDC005286 TaxID=3154463 RepID=UPI0033AD3741
MSSASGRSLRSDASRNREQLLTAARRVFAEQGPEAALEEVARAAGVSRMTLYRHFATRDELIAIVLQDNVAHIEQRARQLDGVVDGAVKLFHEILALQLEHKGLVYLGSRAEAGWVVDLSARTAAAFAPLLDLGRATGIVWREITEQDVLLALHMAGAAVTASDARDWPQVKDTVHGMLHRSLFATQFTSSTPTPP